LSVVVQTFALVVFIYLCAGEDLFPSSADTDEGCQWEIQTDEGWVPYWDSHVLIVRAGSLSSRAKSACLSRETNASVKILIIL
jgi:hypothetical protein